MLRWYADETEVNAGFGSEIPDLFIFGGIVADLHTFKELRCSIEDVKRQCGGDPYFPLKWNFKEVKKKFEARGESELYTHLLRESRDVRRRIFEVVSRSRARVLLSCILGHSNQRSILIRRKPDLLRHAFANGLMRFALEVRDSPDAADGAEIVLDWPTKGNAIPFDSEYSSAFSEGKTLEGQDFQAGPLGSLGFADSILYGNDCHSCLLQVADLFVGAFREFVEVALGRRTEAFGLEMLRLTASNLRGAPEKIMGRGVIVSPEGPMKDKVKATVEAYLAANTGPAPDSQRATHVACR